MQLSLPDMEIQNKYVDVYNAMLSNQLSYESGLEDLNLVCDAYIEERNEKNEGNAITLFQGVNVDHVLLNLKESQKILKMVVLLEQDNLRLTKL